MTSSPALTVTPFDPHTAPDADLAALHALWTAAVSADMPEDPVPSYEVSVGQARKQTWADSERAVWAARVDGTIVGLGDHELLGGVNSAIGYVQVRVHPGFRRRGIGTALLRPIIDSVAAGGRTIVLGLPVKPESPGAAWAAGLGFTTTHNVVIQRLVTRGEGAVEPRPAAVAPGYRLVEWTSAAPDELLASFATARQAIADAPSGGSSYHQELDWTPESIREWERHNIDSGAEERVAVVVDEADGSVAGLTMVIRYKYRLELGYQMDTSVLPPHRGHGLGLALKSAMLRTLVAEWPELERIHTSNSTENTHMLAVNEAMGFRPLRELRYFESPTSRLVATLAELQLSQP